MSPARMTHKQKIALAMISDRMRHDPEAQADMEFLADIGAHAWEPDATDDHGAATIRDFRRLCGLTRCIQSLNTP